MKKQKKHLLQKVIMIMFVLLFLTGCNTKQQGGTANDTPESENFTTEKILYMVMENNITEETLRLYSYKDGYEYSYKYALTTSFKDKYGKIASYRDFIEGNIVTIGSEDSYGYLTEVQMSDSVWKYENISRFSINGAKGIFTIAETKYSIDETVKIFSNKKQISFEEITENDILTVIGTERQILSVIVTTGHGTLVLKNTKLFEGSLIQLNKNIFEEITKDMTMELSEGVYTLTVANNGWGGTSEITIKRGEKTEVDLDKLKGEGKKKGFVTFETDIEDIQIKIDGKVVEHTKPVEITYGVHTIEIQAEGYTTWKKYLTVNSPEATLVVELEEESVSSETETESESQSESQSTQESENTEESDSSEDREQSSQDLQELLQDALNELLNNQN